MSPRNQLRHHRSSVGRRHPAAARRIALATSGVLIAGVGMFVGVTSASAAVPTFPDNLAVFPDRDFVSIEGYAGHAGDVATLEVTRPGVGVVGSAKSKVSGGDVAFEVNHPGGVCWGADTGLKVTPDIKPGDVVSIRFPDGSGDETTVGDGYVTGKAVVVDRTVTVVGHVGSNINKDNTEQRIIQPAFKDTAVNRRDVRAVPGPMTPAAKGGYSSMLEFNGDTFKATYVFDTPELAQLAGDPTLAPRLMSWEVVDLAGNRQGLTIAEFGESGGPGMGGCPNGPLSSGPVGPTNIRAVELKSGTTVTGVKLNWTPAVAVAGTQPILGYRVTAVAQSINSAQEQQALQVRVLNPSATGATLNGFAAGTTYKLEVESVSSVGVTNPALKPDIEQDAVPPTLKASPAGGSFSTAQTVTLSSDEPGTDIYYTTDGRDPVDAAGAATYASHYKAPITLDANTTLKYAGFDPAGNVSLIGEQQYTITNTPVPSTPTITSVVPANGSATVNWSAGDSSVTGYTVRTFDSAGAPAGSVEVSAPATTTTVTGLTPDASYTFTVSATNANGPSAESPKSAPVVILGSAVANAGPDQTVARAVNGPSITLTSAGSSTVGATYSWSQLNSAGTAPIADDSVDRVDLRNVSTSGSTLTFSAPAYKAATAGKVVFRLTVSVSGVPTPKTDDVTVFLKNDQVQIATARWKAGDFRVTGGGSVTGATVNIYKYSTKEFLGSVVLVAPVPPAVGATFDFRSRSTAIPLNVNPGRIYLESNLGGTTGPFTVG